MLQCFIAIVKFPNSVRLIVDVNVNVNLESQPHASTNMGRYKGLSCNVHVYCKIFSLEIPELMCQFKFSKIHLTINIILAPDVSNSKTKSGDMLSGIDILQ